MEIITTEKEETVYELKELCTTIGCSGVDPDMCKNRPQNCELIRKKSRSKSKQIYKR